MRELRKMLWKEIIYIFIRIAVGIVAIINENRTIFLLSILYAATTIHEVRLNHHSEKIDIMNKEILNLK